MTPTFQQQPLLSLGLNPSNSPSDDPGPIAGPMTGVATGVQSRQIASQPDTRTSYPHTQKQGTETPRANQHHRRRIAQIDKLATDRTLVRVHSARQDDPAWPAAVIQSTAIWAMLQSARRMPCVIARHDVLRMAALIAAKHNWPLRFGTRAHSLTARQVLDHLAKDDLTWIKYGKQDT